MILFKACPRCGGDVDATHPEDVFCVQCSHRPMVAYPGPRVINPTPPSPVEGAQTSGGRYEFEPDTEPLKPGSGGGGASCPRCGSAELVPLDKLRPEDHACYRCRRCGHVFSPVTGRGEPRQATPT